MCSALCAVRSVHARALSQLLARCAASQVCIAALSGGGPGGGADDASAASGALACAGGVQQVNVDIRLRRPFSLTNETRGVIMHVCGFLGPPTLPNAPQAPRGSLLF